ncbi:MAG: MFS transporter [Anaerolineae bacterium]|nr:MFS transporter [Anaerolineae bacterium]
MPQRANRKLLFIGFIGFIAVGMPNAALGVAWASMQTTFGVSLDSIGILLTAVTIGRLVMSVYSGRVIGWIGLGNYMLIGSVIMLAGLLGYALTPSWPLLVFAALVFGFGVTALNTGINNHAAAHYGSGTMNWLHAWYGLGSSLGPLVVTLVVINLGLDWRWAYGIFIAMQIALTAVFAITRSEWKLDARARTTAEPERPKATLRETLGVVPALYGMTLFFLHGGIQIGTGQLTNSLLTDSRGVDPATAGLWISIYWAGLTAGRIFTGMVVSRVGNNRYMRINMFLTILGTLLLWSNLSNNLTFLGIAVIGFTLGPVLPTLLADTPRRVGLRHQANTVGLQIAASGIGLALLPGLAAFVAERAGLETIGAYLFLVALVSFVVHEGLVLHDRHERQSVTVPVVAGD